MSNRRSTAPVVEVARPMLPAVHSNESGRSYQLDRLIGKGGFGEIYLATPTPRGVLLGGVQPIDRKLSHMALAEAAPPPPNQ